MRAPVVLHAVSSFEQDTLDISAGTIVAGLTRCVNQAAPLRTEITTSPDFWSILQRLHKHQEAAPATFELLQTIVESNQPSIGSDNYESAVGLANDFASAAAAAWIQETRGDASSRKTNTPMPAKAK